MAALAPPLNNAGVPLPPVPANPASLVDITNAKEYVDRLSSYKCEPILTCSWAGALLID